jgi:hypothetical protein
MLLGAAAGSPSRKERVILGDARLVIMALHVGVYTCLKSQERFKSRSCDVESGSYPPARVNAKR